VVGRLDPLEHRDQVADAQPVQRDVAESWLEVDPDVRGVVAAGGAAQVVLAGEPLVEPLAGGQAALRVAPGAEPPVDLLGGRQRAAVAGLVPDHVADERGEVVVAACEIQQPADLFELGDSVSLVLRYGAPEPPLAAAGRDPQHVPVPAVSPVLQLRAVAAELAAGVRVAAAALPVGRSCHGLLLSSGVRPETGG
jgi:hypothetical protein